MEEQETSLFQSLWPGMIQRTRLLIVDHDVTRYHSLDLLRWQLDQDAQHNDFAHFSSMKIPYRFLLDASRSSIDMCRFMRDHVADWNIYQMFDQSYPGVDPAQVESYEDRLNVMLADPKAKAIQTDIATQFGNVFNRKDVKGYMFRYKKDTVLPAWAEKCRIFESDHVLNLDSIADIIIQQQINAVMIANVSFAVQIATYLLGTEYSKPITFMIGKYAYNFVYNENAKAFRPKLSNEMGKLEVLRTHEFGYFDPFSGITYQDRLERLEQEETNERKYAEQCTEGDGCPPSGQDDHQ